MNGCGKTSLLIGLYLGLFGRHGLRFVEGLRDDDESTYYRGELEKFRRWGAPPDDPTFVEIGFAPMAQELRQPPIRVRRIWHFQSSGKLAPGDGAEDVHLYVNDEPVAMPHATDEPWRHQVERLLFPPNFLPAFFFDGEQAQRLIFEGADDQLQRDVAVLYGTEAAGFMHEKLRSYVTSLTQAAGGRHGSDRREQEMQELEKRREGIEAHVAELHREQRNLSSRRAQLDAAMQAAMERLRSGGGVGTDLAQAQQQLKAAEQENEDASSALLRSIADLGLALAVSRLLLTIKGRLTAEELREQWLAMKAQTEDQTDSVLAAALPEPPESDELLGLLHPSLRESVRERFRLAIQLIYNPPPVGCAEEFLLGFAKGEARQRLGLRLADLTHGLPGVSAAIARVRDARERIDDAKSRICHAPEQTADLEVHRQVLTEATAERDDVTRQLLDTEREIAAQQEELGRCSKRIGEIASELQTLRPEFRRIQVAERAATALRELSGRLEPLACDRLRDRITHHFLNIADMRFRGSEVVFEAARPFLRRAGEPDKPIESMSGFERRAYGIAYSLALAEATGRRIPLVIDTPLGNADSEYRSRLLQSLAEVDLDQVIVLPHDAEVPASLLGSLSGNVLQTFLLEFDPAAHESRVRADSYFGTNGASRWT